MNAWGWPDEISGSFFVRVLCAAFGFGQVGGTKGNVIIEHESGNRLTVVPQINCLAPRTLAHLLRQAYVPPGEFYRVVEEGNWSTG
ncbi:hypothetical protein GCM10010324_30300 [Streptomyces hiroshimensis]|uniref:Type II toxin-antitoxin system HicA family toxin n=1 Tax=Streptomyces hiroshimensis TaxID=66424 RepID=A0ABQ2YGZ5_9ACTN|nr:hypothetical protein GCM10010324_30300 [Streptomyces hiroshimensis]